MSHFSEGVVVVIGRCSGSRTNTLSVDLRFVGLCTMRFRSYYDATHKATGYGEVILYRMGQDFPFITFNLARLSTINKMAKRVGLRKLPRSTDDRRRGLHRWEQDMLPNGHIDAHHPSRG